MYLTAIKKSIIDTCTNITYLQFRNAVDKYVINIVYFVKTKIIHTAKNL